MKKTWLKFTALAVAMALLSSSSLMAQDEKGDKEKKEEKEVKEKKDLEQIIITRTKNNEEKVVIEVKGDKVTINGKPVEDFKDNENGITVNVHKLKSLDNLARISGGNWSYSGNDNFNLFKEDANRAMLGVTTESADGGAEINSITKESAAEKMGLKEGDVITKVDDKKIENPDDLTAAIKAHKPGDKVSVTYLRDKKEQKASADLTKWKSQNFQAMGLGDAYMKDMNKYMEKSFPRVQGKPGYAPYGQNWSWSGGSPKLGLSVQDTDDGKGVKIIEVDEESNAAKAGIKIDDLVTEVDGKAVNSTDDMVKIIKESKDKTSVMVKLQRAGKTQNIEVKMPRKIKTADM